MAYYGFSKKLTFLFIAGCSFCGLTSAHAQSGEESLNQLKARARAVIQFQEESTVRLETPLSREQLGEGLSIAEQEIAAFGERSRLRNHITAAAAIYRLRLQNRAQSSETFLNNVEAGLQGYRCRAAGPLSTRGIIRPFHVPIADTSRLIKLATIPDISPRLLMTFSNRAKRDFITSVGVYRAVVISRSERMKQVLSARLSQIEQQLENAPEGSARRARLMERYQDLRQLRRRIDAGITALLERTARACGEA